LLTVYTKQRSFIIFDFSLNSGTYNILICMTGYHSLPYLRLEYIRIGSPLIYFFQRYFKIKDLHMIQDIILMTDIL